MIRINVRSQSKLQQKGGRLTILISFWYVKWPSETCIYTTNTIYVETLGNAIILFLSPPVLYVARCGSCTRQKESSFRKKKEKNLSQYEQFSPKRVIPFPSHYNLGSLDPLYDYRRLNLFSLSLSLFTSSPSLSRSLRRIFCTQRIVLLCCDRRFSLLRYFII
jgi:hypothetical protein